MKCACLLLFHPPYIFSCDHVVITDAIFWKVCWHVLCCIIHSYPMRNCNISVPFQCKCVTFYSIILLNIWHKAQTLEVSPFPLNGSQSMWNTEQHFGYITHYQFKVKSRWIWSVVQVNRIGGRETKVWEGCNGHCAQVNPVIGAQLHPRKVLGYEQQLLNY